MKYLAFSLALCIAACASTPPEKLQGADYYFEEGQKAMEKNRCLEASEHFKRLVSNFPGSRLVAEAQFLLAEAHFCNRDWVNAAFEYQRIVDIYPSSEWAVEAQFKVGESHFKQLRRPELDQKETFEALTAFRNFIEDNPDAPLVEQARRRIAECRSRLAQKEYLSGRLYHKQGYFDAAKMIYEEVLREYPDVGEWYYNHPLPHGRNCPRSRRCGFSGALLEGSAARQRRPGVGGGRAKAPVRAEPIAGLKMRRIGVIGGTFDPIHHGHLLLARFALEQIPLDEVLFIPAGRSAAQAGCVRAGRGALGHGRTGHSGLSRLCGLALGARPPGQVLYRRNPAPAAPALSPCRVYFLLSARTTSAS